MGPLLYHIKEVMCYTRRRKREYFSVTLDNYVAELLPAVFCREELKQFCCDSFILNQALKRTWSVRLGVFPPAMSSSLLSSV
jgi:hypothetical protein